MDKQAEVLIDNYESERNGEILKQFNSLKPRPFAGVISLILLMAGLYAANSIFDVELMDSGYYWLVLLSLVFLAL